MLPGLLQVLHIVGRDLGGGGIFLRCWLPPKASQVWGGSLLGAWAVARWSGKTSMAAAAAAKPNVESVRFLIFDIVNLHAAVGGVADHVHQPADQRQRLAAMMTGLSRK